MGLWVQQRRITQLPQASIGLSGLWLGDAGTAMAASDDYLLLLAEIGQVPFGITGGHVGMIWVWLWP